MNPESPQNRPEDLEVSLTAMILGELPPAEGTKLRQAMARDPQLAALHKRLVETIGLVQTASSVKTPETPAPLKLSSHRREKLLQSFKTASPVEFQTWHSRISRWAVPVGIAALLAAVLGHLGLQQFHLGLNERVPSAELARVAPSDLPVLDFAPANLEDGRRSSGTDHSLRSDGAKLNGKPETANQPAPQHKSNIVLPSRGLSTGETAAPADAAHWGYFSRNSEQLQRDAEKSQKDSPLTNRSKTDREGREAAVQNYSLNSVGYANGNTPAANDRPVPSDGKATVTRGEDSLFSLGQKADSYTITVSPGGSSTTEASGVQGGGSAGGGGLAGGFGGMGGEGHGGGLGGGVMDLSGKLDAVAPVPASGPASASKPASSTAGRIPSTNIYGDGNMLGLQNTAGDSVALRTDKSTGVTGFTYDSVDRTRYLARQADKGAATLTGPIGAGAADQPLTDGLEFEPKVDSRLAGNGRPEQNKQAKGLSPGENYSLLRPVPVLGDLPVTGRLFRSDALGAAVPNSPKAAEEAPARAGGGVALADRDDSFGLLAQTESKAKVAELAKSRETRFNFETERLGEKSEITLGADEQAQVAPAEDLKEGLNKKLQREKTTEKLGLIAGANQSARGARARQLDADEPVARPATPAPQPQPEILTAQNPFSTFSMNVADVSFKLAAASLEQGAWPQPATLRSEEFLNAFDYRDPEPPRGVRVGFTWERARSPFAQNRDLLRFAIKTAAQGRSASQPLNIVLLLDNSGSMERADRVRIVQEALRVLAAQLGPQDRLSIVTFARTARLWVDGVAGGPPAAQAMDQAGRLTPQGGTNLEEAMALGYSTALRHYTSGGINRVVLLTDGAANLGDVDPASLKKSVETHRREGIALDCFGIGWEGYNDDLLETLARNGDGRYGFLNAPEQAATEFAARLAGALRLAASNVKVQVEFNPARVQTYRQIGYAKLQLTKEQFRDNTVDAGEMGAAESGNALYAIQARPDGAGPLATVRVRYKVPATGQYREQQWEVPYTRNPPALDQSSPAMRLAGTAAAFSEWLAGSPFAAEVTPDRLLEVFNGVPAAFGADPRPGKLEWMIRQAKSLSGK